MALKMKDFADPQPESGQGLHTQESGHENLSVNLAHSFFDTYERTLTNQPEMHSSVRIIPKEQNKMPLLDEKVFQKIPSEEDMADFDQSQKPIHSSNTMQEEEAVKRSPKASTFMVIEEKKTSEEDCFNEAGEEPRAEDEPVEQQRGRNGDQNKNRKRTRRAPMAKKKRLFLGLALIVAILIIAAIVAVAQRKNYGSSNNGSINSGAVNLNSGPDIIGSASYCPGSCFTCMDKGKCLNMTAIFRDMNDEHPIYQKDKTQPFPKCFEMKAPENNTCSVCSDQDAIRICCSNVPEIMVEESGGGTIKDIQKECETQPTPGPD